MKAFECKMCGKCCHGKGGITLQGEEAGKVANFLGIDTESFVAEYCEEKGGRLSVRTGPDEFCIFYDKEKSCLIHPVKPGPCVSWPFYPALLRDKDNWEMAKDACPGLNPDASFEEFVSQYEEEEISHQDI